VQEQEQLVQATMAPASLACVYPVGTSGTPLQETNLGKPAEDQSHSSQAMLPPSSCALPHISLGAPTCYASRTAEN